MIYQLRFLNADLLKKWVEDLALRVDLLMPLAAPNGRLADPEVRIKKIKKEICRGLRSAVYRRALCGSRPFCDEAVVAIKSNLLSKRLPDIQGPGPVKRYLLEDSAGVDEAAGKIAFQVFEDLAGEDVLYADIWWILREGLARQCYGNVWCGKEAPCDSEKLDLEPKFAELGK